MISDFICGTVRLLCGATANWAACPFDDKPRIFFANHSSHLDFLLLWASLPADTRRKLRPVAAKEYWTRGSIRHYFARSVFRAVLVDRKNTTAKSSNPMSAMMDALKGGDSLMIFPEGSRQSGDCVGPFKPGIFHLARKMPGIELVPVYLDNLNRILPKGEVLPVPLLSSVTFGSPLQLREGESKNDFLARTRQAVVAIKER